MLDVARLRSVVFQQGAQTRFVAHGRRATSRKRAAAEAKANEIALLGHVTATPAILPTPAAAPKQHIASDLKDLQSLAGSVAMRASAMIDGAAEAHGAESTTRAHQFAGPRAQLAAKKGCRRKVEEVTAAEDRVRWTSALDAQNEDRGRTVRAFGRRGRRV